MNRVWGVAGLIGEPQDYTWLESHYNISEDQDHRWFLILQYQLCDLSEEDFG